jgi:hypothetical protein
MNTKVNFCAYGTLLTTEKKLPLEGHFLSINPISTVGTHFNEAFYVLTHT